MAPRTPRHASERPIPGGIRAGLTHLAWAGFLASVIACGAPDGSLGNGAAPAQAPAGARPATLGASAGAAAEDPVEARTQVDRAVATTGDRITYTVTVEYDPAYEVFLPEPGTEIAGFRIVDLRRDERTLDDGRKIDERTFVLRADLVGSYILPGLEIRYRPVGPEGDESPDETSAVSPGGATPGNDSLAAITTSEIFVEVASVLPEGEELTDIRDIKPLRPIAEPLPWIWIGAGLLLLLALGGFWLLRRRRHAAPVPALPPHEVAFNALAELRRLDFSDPEVARSFFFRVSETVRTYLEGRFGLNATDLTTEEIVERLGELGSRAQGHRRELVRFLQSTDRVKFAGHEAGPEEIETTYEQALSFVEATRPLPEEDTEVEEERHATEAGHDLGRTGSEATSATEPRGEGQDPSQSPSHGPGKGEAA